MKDSWDILNFTISIIFLVLFALYIELFGKGALELLSILLNKSNARTNSNKKIVWWWLVFTLNIVLILSTMIFNIVIAGNFIMTINSTSWTNLMLLFMESISIAIPPFVITLIIGLPFAIIAFIIISIVRYIRLAKKE